MIVGEGMVISPYGMQHPPKRRGLMHVNQTYTHINNNNNNNNKNTTNTTNTINQSDQKRRGLLHVRDMAEGWVDSVTDMVAPGQETFYLSLSLYTYLDICIIILSLSIYMYIYKYIYIYIDVVSYHIDSCKL